MKYLIIGLGNFGSSLAIKLTQAGEEVIGVDNKMSKVETLKESISHTICIDCTDEQAVKFLPLNEVDVVIIAIGEDEGANIMATAIMKKLEVKRLISRAVSSLHETILQAMGVYEIVHPEEETADRWAKKLKMKGVIDSFDLTGEYSIIEILVPQGFVGMQLHELDLRKRFNILVLTTINVKEEKSLIGRSRKVKKIQGVAAANTILNKGDILVLYGKVEDIEKLLATN